MKDTAQITFVPIFIKHKQYHKIKHQQTPNCQIHRPRVTEKRVSSR